ncbi:MAG: hypothetical protein JKY70_22640 [Mucilaginibacter sp.]|nr:hypothetical protein [Mucilaginibacter sp.]
MQTEKDNAPIENLMGPADLAHTDADGANAGKDAVQENLEGAEPSKEETEVDPKDADLSRSE